MVAQVIINSNVRDLNKTFDYSVPNDMQASIFIGSRILVPFGRSKEYVEAFVIGFKEKSDFKLKDIAKIEDNKYLSAKEINLAKLMSKRYFCNISDCIKLMLPPGTTTTKFENRVNDKMMKFVYLLKDTEEIERDIDEKILKSDKQIRALNFLILNEEVSMQDLQQFSDVSPSIIKTLEKKGYIEIVEKEIERNPFIHKVVEKTSNLKLSGEQKEAYESVKKYIDKEEYKEFLLFGITGSGKTEVYLQLIEQVLLKGKSSILLVPEISLTPQTVDRFISRFGEKKIAVLHSKLSIGERYDQWKKIQRGEAKIIIGARSAIFAPVRNLGIIIIDEEHDESYKSETNPRYNAKDIANYLAKLEHIPLILGSATPDIKTYYNALTNKVQLLKMTKRANSSSLPEAEIIDLRNELIKGNKSMISRNLYDKISRNLKNKKQTILFLNRRGFATFIMCRDCGYTAKCHNCDITLTYHIKERKLKCHYCGYETKELNVCPSCNSKNIRYFGTGTQKLELQIKEMFPNATTIRMDVDTVTKKNSHEAIINKFKNEKIDILIGTQMVVKGHDFPNVTLVGVIAADSSLNINDYRASERTFQILTQVAGRAGRGTDKGNVIIQTYNPDNFSIECAKEQDYQKFYDTEIELRRQLSYPPFCDIIQIGINGNTKSEVEKISKEMFKYLKNIFEKNNIDIKIFNPVPSPIEKIKNKIRWRIIVKCKLNSQIIAILNDTIIKANEYISKNKSSCRIIFDTNPYNMF